MNALERLIQAFENYKNSTTFNLPKRNVPTKSIVDNEKLTALANSIRTKTGSSDGLTIDDMKTAVDNFSGGATIENDGEYIPVPNEGYLDKIYFNVDLTPEEVERIIASANIQVDENNEYFIAAFDKAEYPLALYILPPELTGGESPAYAIVLESTNPHTYIYVSSIFQSQVGFSGWNTEFFNYVYEQFGEYAIPIEQNLRSTYGDNPVGIQNNLLAKLINIGGSEGYKKVLSGKYEPVELEINEPKKVDLTTYMDNQQMPISVNVVGGGEDRLKKLLDATQSAYYLFYNFKGNNVDDLISYNDTENVTNMCSMFNGCNNLTTIPLLNTSSVTNMGYMFQECRNLTTIPQLDTSSVTRMDNMFYNCRNNLTTIPLLNTSSVTDMTYMFKSCELLTTIPQLDTSSVTNMSHMFNGCKSLTTIPQLDTSKVTYMTNMFYQCTNLTTIPLLDMSNISIMSSTFDYCSNLTDLTLKNIKVNLNIGSGTGGGNKLTLDSLINTCKECINVGSSRKLTIGTANIAKIENIYVRFTNTDITSIELNEKGEVEVCESTDEGAMTIAQYMSLKNWSLA